jgi:hypothetical protein
MIKLSDVTIGIILQELPAQLLQRYGQDTLIGAVEYLKPKGLRFNENTGKVYDNTGVRSAIHKYKTNPYSADDLSSIIGNEFAPIIGDQCSHFARVGCYY